MQTYKFARDAYIKHYAQRKSLNFWGLRPQTRSGGQLAKEI